MSWQTPIIDRTQADVDHARSNSQSDIPLKGARNISDLERVRDNTVYISNIITRLGIFHEAPIDVIFSEIPRDVQVQSMIDNVRVIRSCLSAFDTAPKVPELPLKTFEKMNDLERILYDIDLLLKNMQAAFRHSGTFCSGMEGLRV